MEDSDDELDFLKNHSFKNNEITIDVVKQIPDCLR